MLIKNYVSIVKQRIPSLTPFIWDRSDKEKFLLLHHDSFSNFVAERVPLFGILSWQSIWLGDKTSADYALFGPFIPHVDTNGESNAINFRLIKTNLIYGTKFKGPFQILPIFIVIFEVLCD